MDNRTLLDFMAVAEKLKCNTRHSWTTSGRKESVAEHTCRLCMFAWLVKDEFPDLDMERVMYMCLFHDLGEAVTGDVPCFEKKEVHQLTEADAVEQVAEMLPKAEQQELLKYFEELNENQTDEAKLVHALDKMEALIQHNEASIDTWLPLEYELQLTYGQAETKAFPYTKTLRKMIEQDSLDKIEKEGSKDCGIAGNGFYVSRNKEKISFERVVDLMRQSYWAKDRSPELIRKAMEGSVCYGVFDEQSYMVGYARIITDYATTFYLMDVIIDERYRHQGLGKMLMDEIMNDVGELHGVLHTDDAKEFYARYGFKREQKKLDQIMEKPR